MSHPSRFLVALAALASLVSPAWAHAHLTAARPPADGTVAAAPDALELTFSEALELPFTGVALTGPDQGKIATGAASLASGGRTLVIPVHGPLPAGTYTVAWHALSTDGHKTAGRYRFTIGP